jgi:ABC-type multidrug transport system fused ATPase/permease subunit
LIRNPRILLLDEATSALDSASEKIIQEALDEAVKERSRTTIAVAHRLSTVMGADCIFVVEGGRVVEWGSHGVLMGRGGVYAGMVGRQGLGG